VDKINDLHHFLVNNINNVLCRALGEDFVTENKFRTLNQLSNYFFHSNNFIASLQPEFCIQQKSTIFSLTLIYIIYIMEHTDQILFDELKSGNQHAYELLFKKFYKMLVAKAYYILEDEMEAEDVVQNLFVTLWQKMPDLEVRTSLKAYLFGAVHNQCMMNIRSRKVADKRLNAYTTLVEQESNLDTEAEIPLILQSDLELIFNELPIQRQRVFRLVYLEDKKYKEAAQEMGLSVNSIKTHLKLAMGSLRDKVKKIL